MLVTGGSLHPGYGQLADEGLHCPWRFNGRQQADQAGVRQGDVEMGLSIFDEQEALLSAVTLTLADGTTPAFLVQGPGRGMRIDSLILSSTAVLAHDVQVAVIIGTSILVGVIAVPGGAGQSAAVPAVEAAPIFPTSIGGLLVANGVAVYIGLVAALLSGETVQALASGGMF